MDLTSRPRLLAFAAVLALCGGCASTWHDVRFTPAPLEVRLAPDRPAEGQARALLTVEGVRRARKGEPARVEARMRIENLGGVPVLLREESLSLVSADLQGGFAAGEVVGADPAPIPPGDSGVYEIHFPVARGHDVDDLDWRGLNLKWTVSFEGHEVTTGVTFEGRLPSDAYYDPYRPRVGVGLGFSIHD